MTDNRSSTLRTGQLVSSPPNGNGNPSPQDELLEDRYQSLLNQAQQLSLIEVELFGFGANRVLPDPDNNANNYLKKLLAYQASPHTTGTHNQLQQNNQNNQKIKQLQEFSDSSEKIWQKATQLPGTGNLKQQLDIIESELNLRAGQLKILFDRFLLDSSTSYGISSQVVKRIKVTEYRFEAIEHEKSIANLAKQLEVSKLTGPGCNLLENKDSQSILLAINIMVEIEKHGFLIEDLQKKSKRAEESFNTWAAIGVTILFFLLFIALPIVVDNSVWGWFNSLIIDPRIGEKPLEKQKLAVIGIPWPIIVWSLIGSFGGMLYRLRKRPFYSARDMLVWIFTRPATGGVLSAILYFVITSGLIQIVDSNATTSGDKFGTADRLLIILAFIVGYSDKFADTLLNLVMKKLPGQESTGTKEKEVAAS